MIARKSFSFVLAMLLLSLASLGLSNVSLDAKHPGMDAFVADMMKKHGMDGDKIRGLLGQAKKRQDILDAISRPAEAKPWHDYRPIFLTQKRIDDGVAFWTENEALLNEVAEAFGVPQEIVVAIIGVETSYGRITGRYPVVDSLTTLAFHYPPRSRFFKSELEQYLLLGEEESLPLDELKGSYAGAMGMGQFISSSYREYAVDFDDDGKRDLWQSKADAIASVANYFKAHRWRPGGPIVSRARVEDGRTLEDLPLKPSYPVSQMVDWGYAPEDDIDPAELATLIVLDGKDGTEHWIAYENFYVISRYNHSALYSMAVVQLSEAIMRKKGNTP